MAAAYYDIDAILTDAQVSLLYPSVTGQTNILRKGPESPMHIRAHSPRPRISSRKLRRRGKSPARDPNFRNRFLKLNSQMKQGTKVELPLWLGEMLAVSNPAGSSSLATLDLPEALSNRVMNALKADPKTVDLRAQAPHFYNIGARMLELFEEEDMVDILTDVRPLPDSTFHIIHS